MQNQKALHTLTGGSAELVFLVAACRVALGDSGAPVAPADIDWDGVERFGRRHRVLPLLAEADAAAGLDLPVPLRGRIMQSARAAAMRHEQMVGRAGDIVRAFEAAGVASLLWRGPVAWPEGRLGGVRAYDDLDFLVPRPQVQRAAEALRTRHFASPESGRVQELLLRSGHELNLRAGEGDWVVELSWAPFERFYLRIEESVLRSSTVQRSLAGVEATVPGAVQNTLLLCAHGAKHAWSRLGWVIDAVLALEGHRDEELDALFHLARTQGVDRMVLTAIALGQSLFPGSELAWPAAATGRQRQTGVELAQAAVRRWSEEDVGRTVRELAEFHWRSLSRRRDRLRYLAGVAFDPTLADFRVLRLGRRAPWLYGLLRPVCVLGRVMGRRGALPFT